MKKMHWGTLLLALAIAVSMPTMAKAEINVTIALPPPIVFSAEPEMIVLPETYVYVVPDSDVDIFFYDGWWWRPWEGRWYRSRHYDSGWMYYQSVPSFYIGISGWRNDYRNHRWGGHQWNYHRIPHQQVQRNWQGWQRDKHWEKQQNWGVQGLKSRETAKPQQRAVQPQQREAKPQTREAAKPQQRTVQPQQREAKPDHSQQQHGNQERGK